MRADSVFQTNKFGSLSVVKYTSNSNVLVRFKNTGYEKIAKSCHIRIGAVSDPMHPTVNGVGFLGGHKHTPKVNGKLTPEYISWKGIIDRCYSEYIKKKQPTYIDCKMDPEWLNFQVFAEWHKARYKSGYQVDKDILQPGNKIYSPRFCRLVPSALNKLLTDRRNDRGKLPQGVSMDRNRYIAQLSIDGKQETIGYFGSASEAFGCYKEAKEKHVKDEAKRYLESECIEVDLYEALMNYEVSK